MNYAELKKLREKFYFTVEDVADILAIKLKSAWVLCSRYTKAGLFIRLKNNFYVLEENWEKFSQEDFLKIANYLQVPSYVSFMTALSIYEITTQVQRDFFESASLKRSARFNVRGIAFNFYKLKRQFYFDFVKKGQIFIATKEKAFVDSVYLFSFGKYKFDLPSLDLNKLDKNKIKQILRVYPKKTKEITEKLCRT